MTQPRLTDQHISTVRSMAGEGYTDLEIANYLGVSRPLVFHFRKKNGIPQTPRGAPRPQRKGLPPPVETTDEHGRRVLKCPTAWAEGAGKGITARPRR